MNSKLSKETIQYILDNFSSHAPDTEVNTNHLNCPSGTDTRSRLYVRKTEDGTKLLAHCFNCGGSACIPTGVWIGVVKTAGERLEEERKRELIAVHKKNCAERGHPLVRGIRYLLPHKYFSGEDEEAFHRYEAFGCLYAPAVEPLIKYRVYVPRDNGIQYCAYPKEHGGWMMILDGDDSGRILIYRPDPTKGIVDDNPVAVVCEDPFSAMKVCLAGHIGIALCGTSLSTEEAFKLSLLFDRFLVWLDNDSGDIRDKSAAIAARLSLYKHAYGECLCNDPKLYTCAEISGIIRGFYT